MQCLYCCPAFYCIYTTVNSFIGEEFLVLERNSVSVLFSGGDGYMMLGYTVMECHPACPSACLISVSLYY